MGDNPKEVQIGPPPPQIAIDIMVPTKDHLELTIKCMDALYNYTKVPFNLIVVDSSTDLTMLYLRDLAKKRGNVTIIHQEVKSGNHFFNLALAKCQTPYLVTCMNSITVEPDWESVALQMMGSDPKIGTIGFKCLFPWGLIESAGIAMAGYTPTDIGRDFPGHRLSTVYEVNACQWAFAMHRVEAIKGLLDEDLFNAHKGWDDIDNCFQVKKAGWKLMYDGLGAAYHYPRSTRGDNSNVARVLNLQNGQLFYMRNGFWDMWKHENPVAAELVEMKDGRVVKKDISDILKQAEEQDKAQGLVSK